MHDRIITLITTGKEDKNAMMDPEESVCIQEIIGTVLESSCGDDDAAKLDILMQTLVDTYADIAGPGDHYQDIRFLVNELEDRLSEAFTDDESEDEGIRQYEFDGEKVVISFVRKGDGDA